MSRQSFLPLICIALSFLFIAACSPAAQNTSAATQPELVTFHGTAFVITTELSPGLWKASGWKLSGSPLDTDRDDIPLDCTLYPHASVNAQWIGGCTGNVRVPKQGAEHIAVMLINQDGSTSHVQVAP